MSNYLFFATLIGVVSQICKTITDLWVLKAATHIDTSDIQNRCGLTVYSIQFPYPTQSSRGKSVGSQGRKSGNQSPDSIQKPSNFDAMPTWQQSSIMRNWMIFSLTGFRTQVNMYRTILGEEADAVTFLSVLEDDVQSLIDKVKEINAKEQGKHSTVKPTEPKPKMTRVWVSETYGSRRR